MTCVASQSNPNKAKGEEGDREEKGRHSHEAYSDNIVVPPVASNSIIRIPNPLEEVEKKQMILGTVSYMYIYNVVFCYCI